MWWVIAARFWNMFQSMTRDSRIKFSSKRSGVHYVISWCHHDVVFHASERCSTNLRMPLQMIADTAGQEAQKAHDLSPMTTALGSCRCLKDFVSKWNSYGWAISKLCQGHLTFSAPRRSAIFQIPLSMMTCVTAQCRVLTKPSTLVTLVVLICHPFHKKQMLVTAGRLDKVLLPPFKIQN